MTDVQEIDRRVTAAEFAGLLHITPTWLRQLELDGKIPPARRDPGSRRKFWLLSEVRRVVTGDSQQPAG